MVEDGPDAHRLRLAHERRRHVERHRQRHRRRRRRRPQVEAAEQEQVGRFASNDD